MTARHIRLSCSDFCAAGHTIEDAEGVSSGQLLRFLNGKMVFYGKISIGK